MDDRTVSPVIPVFGNDKSNPLTGGKDLKQVIMEEGNFILKVILGGEGGVGKTTLVTQFVDEAFANDYKPTIGVSIMKKAVTFPEWKIEVRFTIFDLAGQQQFQRVRMTYFQGAKAGFLVYDCTRPDTFEAMRKWYVEAKKAEKDIMLMLIANKVDLVDQRKVSEEEGKKLAVEFGIPYMEVNALNKEIVNDAFKALAFMFIQRHAQLKNV